MAAKKQTKEHRKRVYCDARVYIAKAEAEFARCNDVEGGWLFLEALWRFLFAHCVYYRCVPHEAAYYAAGRGENRCVASMLREQAAMRRELLNCGALNSDASRSRSFMKLFAAMAATAADCLRGTLKDDRYLDSAIAYFSSTLDCQREPGGDIRQPRKLHKGDWTVRDGRKKHRQTARGRSRANRSLVQPKAGGRV